MRLEYFPFLTPEATQAEMKRQKQAREEGKERYQSALDRLSGLPPSPAVSTARPLTHPIRDIHLITTKVKPLFRK